MRGRLRSVSSHARHLLTSGWAIAQAPATVSIDPASAERSLEWLAVDTVGVVAAALRSRGEWSLDSPARRFDAEEWWYRLRFDAPPARENSQIVLGFDGLATLASAWLNGEACLRSENMFLAHEVEIHNLRERDNELLIRFSPLDQALEARRPRPRWRTPMVENQQLRWFRTTLLGRTPGWSPPAAAVGPWRPVWLECRRVLDVSALTLHTSVQESSGIVDVSCEIQALSAASIGSVALVVSREGRQWHTPLTRADEPSPRYTGRLEIPHVARWWPHTHGEPALYQANLRIVPRGGDAAEIDAGRIGFRTVEILRERDDFQLRINDVPVFCRGACWTPIDSVSLYSDGPEVDQAIAQARAAGMNMIRVGGTMCYESDRFLDACDEQGLLLWQDFMFANMDYPLGDATFDESVTREVRQVLKRLSGHASVAVLCGNSEGEQQAAMWGAPRERWSHPLFHDTLAQLAANEAPQIPYWPSSAHGGAFPHQGNAGTTSYYGVGAYRLPPGDARRAEVRFASECLAFANVPEEDTLATLPGGLGIKVHHPAWKARSPRDLGAGWDFDDIRDHYLATLFGVDPLDLRYADHDRYLDLGRVASGEAMAAAFREWRRTRTSCNGALVWFMRDLWPGAGWGVVDARGVPKAAYWFLKRVLQPRTVLLTDEGGNGVFAHITNESGAAWRGTLEIALFRAGEIAVGSARETLTVNARETLERPLAALFEGFLDLNHAYRFGPPTCDVVVASLKAEDGAVIARDFQFPLGLRPQLEPDVGLSATARTLDPYRAELVVTSRRLAQYVTVRVPGFTSEDQYFHIAPGTEHRVRLQSIESREIKGHVRALNSAAICKFTASS